MVWASSPFAHRIEFSAGFPTGAVSYRLLANDGTTILYSASVTPPQGAVEAMLPVAAQYNTCALPLFEARTLSWDYTTAQGIQSDRIAYRVNRALPFPATPAGVRNKLGLSDHEMLDENIDLVTAYADIVDLIGSTAIDAVATSGSRSTLLVVHAIEAAAGLLILPSLQLRAAQRESSGTNEFSRFGSMDWEMLEAGLRRHIDMARAAVDDTFDAVGTAAFIFGTAPHSPDAITGEEA